MSVPIDQNKVVIVTGAGVSAESGLQTFRDSNGLWNNHSVHEVASPEGWKNDPSLVLEFYNQRRRDAANAVPNKAHLAIAKLQDKYDVVVITQNVDDLHERAGSSNVIHVHGELTKARSVLNGSNIIEIGNNPIKVGDVGCDGAQLRPHIVWFGENIENYEVAVEHIKSAARVLVVGTSLTVYPAAGILKKARFHAEKLVIQPELEKKPFGFKWLRGTAANLVPHTVDLWMAGRKVT